jgi:hypothetical protein
MIDAADSNPARLTARINQRLLLLLLLVTLAEQVLRRSSARLKGF